MRGRKPPARARDHPDAPVLAEVLPRCPPHLSAVARKEWRRLATPLFEAGVLTLADRAALAAYCQAWGRWVEAEGKLAETPALLKTPSGYVQQSPWLSIANKQLEIMGRYMAELGLTPVSRSRVAVTDGHGAPPLIDKIQFVVAYQDADGTIREEPMPGIAREEEGSGRAPGTTRIDLDPRL
ncbi:phage terminase small subunit P27 family [Meridianimarinicoccus roseus]|uniref:Phage terminase small subunit P27 family n=1 Tax=Meridianimarinicoccus roseus TaxID=2072018 RepID=A0A2V2LFZ0_9RHOB|nr:phage terminase small subunit P27 family [Meridianimarinicoccus roseus]PWR02424.1 phage terminase small subunit P27 family [Meridianimarinicoccus roseus]